MIFERDVEVLKARHHTRIDLNGLAIWTPESIRRPEVFCYFCHEKAHPVQECRYLNLKTVAEIKIIPPALLQNLSMLIEDHYVHNRIRDEDQKRAEDFINELQNIIVSKLGYLIELHQFGSFKSGFGSRTSDFDLCIANFSKVKVFPFLN